MSYKRPKNNDKITSDSIAMNNAGVTLKTYLTPKQIYKDSFVTIYQFGAIGFIHIDFIETVDTDTGGTNLETISIKNKISVTWAPLLDRTATTPTTQAYFQITNDGLLKRFLTTSGHRYVGDMVFIIG